MRAVLTINSLDGADSLKGSLPDVDVERVHDVTIRMKPRSSAVIYGDVAGIDPGSRQITVEASSGDASVNTSSESGKYRILNAPTGTVTLNASTYGNGVYRSTRPVVVEVAPHSEVRADLRFADTFPISGRVLALLARPGMRLMGQSALGHPEASTVVSLYDPAQLQVRADVRLEDVPRVQPGQKVKIETPAAPGGPLEGVVLFSTSQADIQKNTLSVKVAIHTPPPTLKPEMLCQVTFLSPPRPARSPVANAPGSPARA